MTETEIKLIVDDLRDVGGGYSQAKRILEALPKDVQQMVYSDRRAKRNVNARRKLIVIFRDRLNLTFPAIAELLHYADHTSVIHHYYLAKDVSSKEREQI